MFLKQMMHITSISFFGITHILSECIIKFSSDHILNDSNMPPCYRFLLEFTLQMDENPYCLILSPDIHFPAVNM